MSSPAPTPGAAPYRCPACAGQGIWHAGREAVACGSCGTDIDAPAVPDGPVEAFEFLPLLRDRPDSGRDWQPGATRVRCSTCGTSMAFPAYLAGRNCEGCGSPALVPCDATGAPVHPSGVVPFALTEAEARDRVEAWLARRRPTGALRRFAIASVRAVYVPGWTFGARARVPWRAERLRTNRKGETEREGIDGVAEVAIDDHFVAASASIPPDLLKRVAPFSAAALRPYDPRYLAGYAVEVYAVNLWDAWDTADAAMQRRIESAVRRAAGPGASGLETWPEWSGQRCRHVLVPVYAVDYTYAGRPFQAVVDGRDGRVEGRAPVDRLRGLLALALMLAILAGVVWVVVRLLRWVF